MSLPGSVCVCDVLIMLRVKNDYSKRISSKLTQPRAISPLGEYCLTDSRGGLVFSVYLPRDYPVKPRKLSQPSLAWDALHCGIKRTCLVSEDYFFSFFIVHVINVECTMLPNATHLLLITVQESVALPKWTMDKCTFQQSLILLSICNKGAQFSRLQQLAFSWLWWLKRGELFSCHTEIVLYYLLLNFYWKKMSIFHPSIRVCIPSMIGVINLRDCVDLFKCKCANRSTLWFLREKLQIVSVFIHIHWENSWDKNHNCCHL